MESYDENGFDENGIHKDTGRKYDLDGLTKGRFNIFGIHKDTRTTYGPDSYNQNGLDENRKDRDGKYHPPADTRYDDYRQK